MLMMRGPGGQQDRADAHDARLWWVLFAYAPRFVLVDSTPKGGFRADFGAEVAYADGRLAAGGRLDPQERHADHHAVRHK